LVAIGNFQQNAATGSGSASCEEILKGQGHHEVRILSGRLAELEEKAYNKTGEGKEERESR